ncbi:TIGR02285 family protein [Chromobacterium violaceum]|uniref:TIGR02285 family protein n=1 Tax=Chromobacterium violaceum TaxID=536 RepID=UPI0009EF8581|nr:TIGR02285 family protein [Chromobacterium violaceum]OQS09816.1 hypothetical protein B0T38_12075 [Chromobacterium violaceum]OQS25951.1 hypothetical protein B0T37_11680 [Chromobacterium violaceum]OQS48844.1 hypothetical protein B0T48_07760 [Chromobacterium violaceum]OQS51369.1 hypothetical protein B0T49_09505 [Chromobacterium violaceum]QRO33862.1 TIGR02285 family protein [Chromobacterium violaceum]
MLVFPPAALRRKLAGFALLAFVAGASLAAEPYQITWVLSDWAPNFIIRDGKPTTGQNDVYLKLIIARWPEAEHRFMVMSTARSTLELQRGSQLCRMNLIPTPEREKFAFFTLTHMQLPLQLVIRRELAAQAPLNEAGEVVLEKLILKPGLRGITAAGRSYTAEVDRLLADRKGESNVREIPNLPSNDGLFKLLELGRADYTLDYEPNVKYREEQNRDHPLASLPIAGAALIPVGIACPRTRWGRMAVMKIDQLLSEAVADPAYRQAQDRWLSPESVQRYRAELDRFYRQRARPADPARYALRR